MIAHIRQETSVQCLLQMIHVVQVKAQYDVLVESVKQTALENLQGKLDSHMEVLNEQFKVHQAQQALSLHKVDMEASIMEVSHKVCVCVYIHVQISFVMTEM